MQKTEKDHDEMSKSILALIILIIFPLLLLSQPAEFSADSAYDYIEHLSVTIGPRPMGSDMEREALDWVQNKFRSFGADTAYIIDFTSASAPGVTFITKSGIAVGIFRGEVDSAIVVGGHIDSDDYEVPGANDNASGAATVAELARIWSKKPRHYTMIFCTFGGEERGLLGSKHFVANYADINNVELMISTDMTASAGDIEIMFEQEDKQSPKWLVRDAYAFGQSAELDQFKYSTHFHAILNLSENGPGSDHKPFVGLGIPAIDFTAGVGDSPIHSPQDNMQFIDKGVMQKYGTCVDLLLSHYQQEGIPRTTNDRFVLWNLSGLQLYIPYWLIILFNVLFALSGVAAFIYARKQRILKPKEERIRFSGLKLLFLFFLIMIFSHFGETAIQMVKGIRYPWVGQINSYILLSFLWIILGLWVALYLSKTWRFNNDPAVYALRTIIILAIFFIPSFMLSAHLAIYPAIAILLFSLAMFVKHPVAKTVFAIGTILPIFRVFFNEEFLYTMYMMTGSGIRINTLFKSLLFNGILTLILVLVSLPLIYSFAYGVFSNERFKSLIIKFRKPHSAVITLVIIIGFSIYLVFQPAYSEKWRPFIRVNAEYNINKKSGELTVAGNEYFKDVRIVTDSLDQMYAGRTLQTEIPVNFAADWLEVAGSTIAERDTMDTIRFDWQIHSQRPWIQTLLEIRSDSAGISDPETDLPHYMDKNSMKFFWYGHYSDTLRVSGQFVVEHGARILRRVRTKYLEMPVPVEVTSQLANVEYRTTVVYQDTITLE